MGAHIGYLGTSLRALPANRRRGRHDVCDRTRQVGRQRPLIFLTKLILPWLGPFRTLHYSIIASDLQLVLLNPAGPTGTLLLLAALSLGSGGVCASSLLRNMQPILLSVFFFYSAQLSARRRRASGQMILTLQQPSPWADNFVSNAVRL